MKILILVCITRLVSDAIAWGFDGLPGLFWGTITRASNYLTFVSNDLVSLVFSVFLWQLVKRGAEKPPLILKAYWALEVIAIAALTLNLYFGWSTPSTATTCTAAATITSSPTLFPLPNLRSCCGCCCATTAA